MRLAGTVVGVRVGSVASRRLQAGKANLIGSVDLDEAREAVEKWEALLTAP